MRILAFHLLGFVGLALATLALVNAPARFEAVDGAIVDNLDFSRGGSGWVGSRTGIRINNDDPRVVALAPPSPFARVYLLRPFPPPKAPVDHVRVTASMRPDALVAGPKSWQAGHLILLSHDARGRHLWYWPKVAGRVEGTDGWRSFSRIYPVDDRIRRMWVGAYNAAVSGSLAVRGITVEGLTERPLFSWLKYTLWTAWLAGAGWVVFVLARRALASPIRILAILAGALIVVGGVAPQPHQRDAIRSTLSAAKDAWRSISARLESPRVETGEPTAPSPEGSAAGRDDASAREPQARPAEKTDRDGRRTARAPPSMHAPPGTDKLAHLGAFALLAFLAGVGYRQYPIAGAAGALLVLSGSIQAVQSLSRTREPGLDDLSFDVAGIGLGLIAALAFSRMLRGNHDRAL